MQSKIYNAATVFIDDQIENGLADKVAFIDPVASVTYGELDQASRRMANLLRAYGIDAENRVALLALDTVQWPSMFFGAIRAGVIPVALNTLLGADQYEYMLADSRARALFVSAALLPVVQPTLQKLPHLKHVFVVDGADHEFIDFNQVLNDQSDDFKTVETNPDEVAFWLYSSGSTGAPKGVQHVHTSLMATAEDYGKGVLAMQRDDVVLSAAKLFFAYGLGNSMSFPMAVGATTILWPGRPTPDDLFALMKQHQPTVFFGVPTLYAAMLANEACCPANGSSALRLCVSAGEALPSEIGRNWHDRFSVPILDGVGSTEMLHIFLSNRIDDLIYGTSGIAVPGYSLKLVDEQGQPTEVGEVGEMMVSGVSASIGYWNQVEKSRNTFAGQWSYTGDKYTCDDNGRYTYCGRTDDMFKVSGIWLSPFEVESALVDHASVLEAAVVAYEDEEGLTKAKAFVVLQESEAPHDENALRESLKEHVKTAIGKWKYPRQIQFTDNLPKTATGKIQRFKLRQ